MYYYEDAVNAAETGVTSMFTISLYVLTVVGMWMLFKKAGEEGWKSLIPFYNLYILYKIGWGNGWFFLLNLVPIANVVVSILLAVKLAKAFGKGGGFAVGLFFLQGLFLIILGLGSATYIGPNGDPMYHREHF